MAYYMMVPKRRKSKKAIESDEGANFSLQESRDHDLVERLHPIFRYGSKDDVQITIESHGDLFSARDKSKYSLLHVLAENTNPGIDNVIKGSNVDLNTINAKSVWGEMALGHAIEYNNYNVIECLLQQGASTDFDISYGCPLHRKFLMEGIDACNVERRLQCMKLLLEYGVDQEIVSTNKRYTIAILDKVSQDQTFELAKPVITQFAIREVLGKLLPNIIRQQILSRNQSKTYFYSRVNEFEKMKTRKIFGDITEFELFTASDKKLSLYARNRRLVSNLPKLIAQIKSDPYNMELLQKRLSKVSQIAESRKKAEIIICQNIGILYGYNAIITSLIIHHFDDEDIKKLL